MKRLILGIVGAAALSLVLLPAATSQAASPQQSPRIEMPDEPAVVRQTDTRRRIARGRPKRAKGAAAGMDHSVDNSFTRHLNRQVLQSLEPAGTARPYPPQ
jgi:hypothetical protein